MTTDASEAAVLLPDLGEDIEEADVLQVYVQVGDAVALEQPIVEIETEKATIDLPSPVAGLVTAIHVRAGDTIRPGDPVLSVNSSVAVAAPPEASPPPIQAEPAQPPPAPAPTPPEAVTPEPATPIAPPPPTAPAPPTPSAPAPPVVAASPLVEGDPEARPVFASPSVRRFAREIGVDIRALRGSGPGGRIDVEDVKRHAREAPRSAPTANHSARSPGPLPDFTEFGAVERVAMNRLRRTIKRNMAAAWHEIPHVTLFHTADVTELEQVRRDYRERAEQSGGRLTITAILLKITAAALKVHPHVNSSLDAEKR